MGKKYIVVIKTDGSTNKYQTYVGWDQIYSGRGQAIEARDRARKVFADAQIRVYTAD